MERNLRLKENPAGTRRVFTDKCCMFRARSIVAEKRNDDQESSFEICRADAMSSPEFCDALTVHSGHESMLF